jgi:anti-sigma factor RsiW
MSEHLTAEEVERYADGELADDALAAGEHLRECARCANAALEIVEMKQAIRAAFPRYTANPKIVLHHRRPATWWAAAAAAVIALTLGAALLQTSRSTAARELIDLHTTILASSNPIDVVSTDRHTVKPWFEGRVPFAVNVPDLAGTPFHLAGGRVVFWRGRSAAYLLVTKGAHRISLFIFEGETRVGGAPQMTIDDWRAGGLTYVAVGDVSRQDLDSLRRALGH